MRALIIFPSFLLDTFIIKIINLTLSKTMMQSQNDIEQLQQTLKQLQQQLEKVQKVYRDENSEITSIRLQACTHNQKTQQCCSKIIKAERTAIERRKQQNERIQEIFKAYENNIDNIVSKIQIGEDDIEIKLLLEERDRLKSLLKKKDEGYEELQKIAEPIQCVLRSDDFQKYKLNRICGREKYEELVQNVVKLQSIKTMQDGVQTQKLIDLMLNLSEGPFQLQNTTKTSNYLSKIAKLKKQIAEIQQQNQTLEQQNKKDQEESSQLQKDYFGMVNQKKANKSKFQLLQLENDKESLKNTQIRKQLTGIKVKFEEVRKEVGFIKEVKSSLVSENEELFKKLKQMNIKDIKIEK